MSLTLASSTAARLRLWSGLILFAFALSHFANHALGLLSLDVMERVGDARRAVTQSLPGSVALYGAFLVHFVLALVVIARQRSLAMAPATAVQILLGLAIPLLLIDHIVGTRALQSAFDAADDYPAVLARLWPGLVGPQTALMLLVWVHGCLGIRAILRLMPWWDRAFPALVSVAVMVPLLATFGWVTAAREQVLRGTDDPALTREMIVFAGPIILWAERLALVLMGGAVLFSVARVVRGLLRRQIRVRYPGDRVVFSAPGQTLLEVSRANGIAHTAVCGGRARCSTCRTRILAGGERLPHPEKAERRVLKRIGAPADVRLACQIRPVAGLSVQPLLPASMRETDPSADRWGVEQTIAVLFVDLRGFTALSERRLPFDVVFILNAYLAAMSAAVRENDGIVDKYIGDAVMALFGVARGSELGAKDALAAAASMLEAMERLNGSLSAELEEPLRIGIGVHLGPAILGRIGAAGAAGGLTALGDTVNTASRLEGATKDLGAPVVVSARLLEEAGASTAGLPGQVIDVRGRADGLAVHTAASAGALRAALGAPTTPEAGPARRAAQSAPPVGAT
ncbi:MAG: adenylate/guanylate cyclase domain-containing protein [Pseudomonadota bacterium]